MIVYLVCYAASLLLALSRHYLYPAQGFWRRRRICMRQTISGVEIFCICGGFSLFPL